MWNMMCLQFPASSCTLCKIEISISKFRLEKVYSLHMDSSYNNLSDHCKKFCYSISENSVLIHEIENHLKESKSCLKSSSNLQDAWHLFLQHQRNLLPKQRGIIHIIFYRLLYIYFKMKHFSELVVKINFF